GNRRQRFRLRPREIFRRSGGEFLPASARAEIIRPPGVLMAMGGLVRVDRHAADRIAHVVPRSSNACGMAVTAGPMVGMRRGVVPGRSRMIGRRRAAARLLPQGTGGGHWRLAMKG